MLTRISKTLSTNVAIAGLVMVGLGVGGTGATLAAGGSPSTTTLPSQASEKAQQKAQERAAKAAAAAAENTENAENGEDAGTRPTDTHGYCVSQIAKSAPTEHTGEGADRVTHGTLVRAAAQACGKEAKQTPGAKSEEKQANGKAYGKGHGTGKPAGAGRSATP